MREECPHLVTKMVLKIDLVILDGINYAISTPNLESLLKSNEF